MLELDRKKESISRVNSAILRVYDTLKNYIFLFFSRGFSILFIYLFNYLLIQKSSLTESGFFLSIISYSSLMINIFNLGQTTLIAKKVTNYSYFNHNKYIFKLFISTWRNITLNFCIVTILYASYIFLSESNFDLTYKAGLHNKVILVFFASYISSILVTVAEFIKSIKEYEKSIFFSLTFPNLLAVCLLMFRSNVNSNLLYEFYILSLIISVVASTIYLVKKIGLYPITFISFKTLYNKSLPYFSALILSQAIYVLDIFFIDIYIFSTDVAVFFVIKKIALIVFLPAQIMSTIFSQKISALSFLGNITNTKKYYKQITVTLLLISLCPLFIILGFGEHILTFWGIEFVEKGLKSLILLSVGYFFIGISYPHYFFLLFSDRAKMVNFSFLLLSNILFVFLCFMVNNYQYTSITSIASIELLIQILMSSFYFLYVHFRLKYSS